MNNLRCSTFGFQEAFCPTWKIKDLGIILDLFGELEEERVYPKGMELKIMGSNVYIHKYVLHHIYGGFYIITLESIEGNLFTMAFIDRSKLDKELSEECESLETEFPFLIDLEILKEKFRKGEDILDTDLEEYVCPLELVYIFLSNYFVFLFHAIGYNYNQFNEAIKSEQFSSVSYIDTEHIKDFMLDDFSLDKFNSLAQKKEMSDIHEELINTLDYVFRNKTPAHLVKSNASYFLKNPIKGVYGLVDKSLLYKEGATAVHFLKEEDALSLIKKWDTSYSESLWEISGKEKYLKEMDTSVCLILLYRGLLNLEYSLACMRKTVMGESISRFQAWRIKRKVKRCL